MTAADSLEGLLRARFGLPAFRPHQAKVCASLVGGADALVVMPTGAGKSLCYQLPAVARAEQELGRTALVVSPLIALMDDQVQKLRDRGFVCEAIHSGRDRLASRAACRAYLAGQLDFLFIAPERLRVPGFPEMLERLPLSLVAVDEAHCISHWGHDFRPEYRLLGERVARFRPAPIVALTATATPQVQADIVAQLGIPEAPRFVSGFRRDNLHVEVVSRTKNERAADTLALLAPADRRPAIVYAPTRKEAESVAALLAEKLAAAPYHAGLAPEQRETTQRAFLGGELDVVVATIAFGMGIDKADVRTVIHTALPATVEGYYQEIGRAGRDGKPSRAILLQSFADVRTLRFLYEKAYPDPADLERVFKALPEHAIPRDALASEVELDAEVLDRAVEKLWMHGGAIAEEGDTLRRGSRAWRRPYEAQRAHRAAQIDQMLRFASTPECRMQQLTRHFGERTEPCGRCDVCAAGDSVAQRIREPTKAERALAEEVLAQVRGREGITVGQLTAALPHRERRELEDALEALARGGAVRIALDSFEKDGRTIEFKRVYTRGGSEVAFVDAPSAAVRPRVRPGKRASKAESAGGSHGRRKPEGAPRKRESAPPEAPPGISQRMERLRAWRIDEAKRRNVPAFRLFSDNVLASLAAHEPTTLAELREVRGVGPALVDRYGDTLLRLLGG